MQRVAIIGPGALGMWLATALRPTAEVTLIGRRQEWAESVNRSGIVCRGWPPDAHDAPTTPQPTPITATTDPSTLAPVDLAILVVKSGQTESALPAVRHLLNNGARAVISLQNGLAHVAPLVDEVGWERLVLGTCTYGVTRLDDTTCQFAGAGEVVIGSEPAAAVWADVQALLAKANIDVATAPDTLGAVWQKALINIGINPITALLDVPNGAVDDFPALHTMATAAVREGAAVAAAHGVKLPGDPVGAMLAVANATATNRSSMLQDIAAGRPTEIDAICGEVVRLGQTKGVPTPINEALLHLVQAREASCSRRGLDE